MASALQRTLEANPELKAFDYERLSAGALREQAALRPLPELRLEAEDVFGTGTARGVGNGQYGIGLSQTIELGGKRGARLAIAEQRDEALVVDQARRQLNVIAELSRRYIHVLKDQEQLDLAGRALTLSAQVIEATERRVNAGRSPTVELRRARITLARSEVAQEHAEHELAVSRQQLAAMWGATEVDFGAVLGDFYALPVATDFSQLSAALEGAPDLRRYAAESKLREAELALAQRKARADVQLDLGIRRLQDSQDEALMLGATLPLFAARQARPAIAQARIARDRVAIDMQARRVDVRARLYALDQELRHALTEAAVLREQVLPETEAALEETRYAYERGRYSLLEWNDAQRELLDARRAYIDAAATAHRLRIDIDQLTGASAPAVDRNPS